MNCDDCYSRDKKSCLKCNNCGFCVTGMDKNIGICINGDFKGPMSKINNNSDFHNNLASYCQKWIYDKFSH